MKALFRVWYRVFPNFTCHVCGERRVPFFARLYGLYHCVACEHKGWRTRAR